MKSTINEKLAQKLFGSLILIFVSVHANAQTNAKCFKSVSKSTYDREDAFKTEMLEYKEYADWPERFSSPDIKWIVAPGTNGLKYQIAENTSKAIFNSENLLAQLFEGSFKSLDKISYGSKNVASKSELESMRLEFKKELSDAVQKGQISAETLLKFAEKLYFKFYLPSVRDVNWLAYRAKTPSDFPQLSYIREFYFEAHTDALSLVPVAAQNVKGQPDFRTLENRALDFVNRIGTYEFLQDYGSGIPSWVKVSEIREFKVQATVILFEKSIARLKQQLTGLSIKELNMLLDEYSRRIDKIEKRSVFWMELLVDNSPEVSARLTAIAFTISNSFNSKVYSLDPIYLLYFRTMRAQVAKILAQE
jgi:hypothetical protein